METEYCAVVVQNQGELDVEMVGLKHECDSYGAKRSELASRGIGKRGSRAVIPLPRLLRYLNAQLHRGQSVNAGRLGRVAQLGFGTFLAVPLAG